MNKNVLLLIIVTLLVVFSVLAITQPPKPHYPVAEFELPGPTGTVTMNFLFESTLSKQNCTSILGGIAEVITDNCVTCNATLLKCINELSVFQQEQLNTGPLVLPSGRMLDGIVTFSSNLPDLALTTCKNSEKPGFIYSGIIQCFPATTTRPQPEVQATALFDWAILPIILLAFSVSWLTVWLILKFEHLHAHISHDHTNSGPQKYHEFPTPRIGGIAIMAGLLSVFTLLQLGGHTSQLSELFPIFNLNYLSYSFGFLLLASLPAFLGGLIEDATKKVGVLDRLLLTMVAGSLGAWLLGAVITRLDIPGIDSALTWLPFAVVLTIVAVGGIANSLNIIDGYNGLASGFTVIVLLGLAFVGHQVGDALVMLVALGMAAAMAGFLYWNWPQGRIFLGDGGAYLTGFMLAELSILLVIRNADVSPWFPLALLIYPVFETLYSIYRRKVHHATSPGQPDNQHLHQLIHDNLIVSKSNCNDPDCGEPLSRLECNSRVAKYLWAPAAVMTLLAGLFWHSTPLLILCTLGYCVFYVFNYRRIASKAAADERN